MQFPLITPCEKTLITVKNGDGGTEFCVGSPGMPLEPHDLSLCPQKTAACKVIINI